VGYASTASSSAVVGISEELPTSTTEPSASISSERSYDFPDSLDPHNEPLELKNEGSDWLAMFNQKVKRVLDVSLMHTLIHER
jgi:glucose repression regulatory protein TUP1